MKTSTEKSHKQIRVWTFLNAHYNAFSVQNRHFGFLNVCLNFWSHISSVTFSALSSKFWWHFIHPSAVHRDRNDSKDVKGWNFDRYRLWRGYSAPNIINEGMNGGFLKKLEERHSPVCLPPPTSNPCWSVIRCGSGDVIVVAMGRRWTSWRQF